MQKLKYTVLISIFISIASVFLFLVGKSAYDQLKIDEFASKYDEQTIEQNGELTSKYAGSLAWNKKSQVKTNTKQLLAECDVKHQAIGLFKSVLNYNSSEDYNQGLKSLNLYMTPAAYARTNSFHPDTSEQINSKKLSSKYISVTCYYNNLKGNKMSVLLKVKSKYSSLQNKEKGILTNLYLATYNTSIGKFEAISYYSQLQNLPILNEVI